ncbi:MAG: helix-turn-helix transcriptional regulator [Kiritimatiellae bacterium]|nr:helix-turn-helix transcriptional regulator [Kiritimatiellia bacterium]
MFAIELEIADGQSCFAHTHACTEIIWYRGCSGWMPQGGVRFRYRDGDVAVYQPGLTHGDACERGGRQICLGISGGGAERLPAGVWRADTGVRAALVQIRGLLGCRDEWRQARLNLLGGWLVVELGRQLSGAATRAPREPNVVSAARRLLDSSYADDLSVTGIAAELGVNPDYLRQLFVERVGEPPRRYLIRKRLEAACDLLRLNQESTAAIAARVGIANPYYFSRLFRRRLGVTPSQYRARYARVG